MNLTSRFLLSLMVVGALPFTAHVASAQTSLWLEVTPPAGQTEALKLPAKRGDRLAVAHGSPPPPGTCPQRGPEAGPPPRHHGKFGPGRSPLAHELAAMETEIGIRSSQIDAWRDFTDALLAVTAPPRRPEPPSPSPGATPPAPIKAEPFEPALSLANDAVERGRNAEKLIKAIDVLRGALTPEQLEKVAALDCRFGPPPGSPRPPFAPGKPGP